jgi:hypothetical protein
VAKWPRVHRSMPSTYAQAVVLVSVPGMFHWSATGIVCCESWACGPLSLCQWALHTGKSVLQCYQCLLAFCTSAWLPPSRPLASHDSNVPLHSSSPFVCTGCGTGQAWWCTCPLGSRRWGRPTLWVLGGPSAPSATQWPAGPSCALAPACCGSAGWASTLVRWSIRDNFCPVE